MNSVNLNYIFDKTYTLFLGIKYYYVFNIQGYSQDEYYKEIPKGSWDGLYERGWLNKLTLVPRSQNPAFNKEYNTDVAITNSLLNWFGINNLRDSDGDGLPDIYDNRPFDNNSLVGQLSNVNIKEIFYKDLSLADNIYDSLGLHIQDTDGDGLPDTYENKIGTDKTSPDTDRDGSFDGQEVFSGTNPLNIDTDGDYVLDGFDLYPLDRSLSANIDNDGDGVDNTIENYIGMNNNNVDTDGDYVLDGFDLYPLNPNNMPRLNTYIQKVEKSVSDNTFLKIQNPVLSSATDIVLVAIMFLTPILFYFFYKFYNILNKELDHYYHTFNNAIGYKEMFGEHKSHKHNKSSIIERIIEKMNIIKIVSHKRKPKKENTDKIKKENTNNTNNTNIPSNTHNKHNIHNEEIPLNLPGQEDSYIDTKVIDDTIMNTPLTEENINNIPEENQDEIILTQKDLELKTKWEEVLSYMNEYNPVFWKIAIIEADTILEALLYDRGYAGKNMSDRLKSANFKSIDDAWNAHKIRNKIAHNDPSGISKRQIKEAINSYKNVFREFGIFK